MSMTGDFFLGSRCTIEMLRANLAAAIGLSVSEVDVLDFAKPQVSTGPIQLITVTTTNPGDYPGQYIAAADGWIVDGFDAIAGRLAQRLRVPVLSAGGDDDPDIMLLSLPDGTAHHVLAEQDDDGGIRNTPEMRALIAAHPPLLDPARAA